MKAKIKENRANHIITHAQDLFFTKGYSMTTVSDVCKLADCSRTTLYTYFESKENLYLAVVDKAFGAFLHYFYHLDVPNSNGMERVLTLSLGYLQFSQQTPRHYQVIMEFYGILRNIQDPMYQTEAHARIKACEYFEKVQEVALKPIQRLVDEIKKGQIDGSILNLSAPESVVINLWAYLKGLADISPNIGQIGLTLTAEVDPKKLVQRMIKTLLMVSTQ